jgi:hypothetical protein
MFAQRKNSIFITNKIVSASKIVASAASGGKMFVYQSAVLILGYSYGYFQGKDLIRVGLILTIVEGLVLAFLVPFYWPLIGLQWLKSSTSYKPVGLLLESYVSVRRRRDVRADGPIKCRTSSACAYGNSLA